MKAVVTKPWATGNLVAAGETAAPVLRRYLEDTSSRLAGYLVGMTRFGSHVVRGGNTVHNANANSMVRKIGHW